MFTKRIHSLHLTEAASTSDATFYLLAGLRVVGLNPPERHWLLYRIWMAIAFGYTGVYVPVSFAMNYVWYEYELSEFLTSLELSLNTWSFVVKLIVIFSLRSNFHKANAYMDQLDRSCKTKLQQKSIRRVVVFGHRVTLGYLVIYGGCATSHFLASLYNKRVPYNLYNPFFNWRTDKMKLYSQAIFEYITVNLLIYIVHLADCYPIVYVEMLRAHVNMLTWRIRNLHKSQKYADSSSKRLHALIGCITDHQTMLNYADVMRPLISGTIFAQFIVCGSYIGISMINLASIANLAEGINNVMLFIAIVVQTFPLCFYCNCLMDDCDAMADSIFHTNWWAEDRQYQKIILYFLQKAQKPMSFSVMNVVPITLYSNIQFAKIAFSVHTIAKGMNLGEQFAKH